MERKMKKALLPVLLILLLLGSISCQFITRSFSPTTGSLDLEIRYSGQWYKETFNYQADAPNIRHLALVVPSEVEFKERAGWVFTSLVFTPSPQQFALREEAYAYEPMLEYLHDAPQGHTVIELAPGAYRLAVAFIAAALPPPNDDALLYAGVTGGGASTEFREIMIEAGKTVTITIELTDENGWGYMGEMASKYRNIYVVLH
jgi:hypothetical protein